MRLKKMGMFGVAIALVSLTAGCTHDEAYVDKFSGRPTDAPPATESSYGPEARWSETGNVLITTWGSSSCPSTPSAISLLTPSVVLVELAPPPDGACTADMAATTFEMELPEEAQESRIESAIVGEQKVQLPPFG
ncbi:hypothetical protein ELQ92_02225 [Labedella populi]|uniref:Uncharacterized protein n=1 Tax=Labedella populi TaxID=2498850 RepID=A0A444QEY3_9MICO|nr:hypothetical protein [Labedella populi]RWZ68088.1 hypothetical protein ELQ92_02225 [Labedella populi]